MQWKSRSLVESLLVVLVIAAMNLRQTHRALSEVISKCQAVHVQLPVDALDGLLGAAEALRHSRVAGKLHTDDAVDELKQRFGLEPKYQQLEDEAEDKRKNQKRRRLRRGDPAQRRKISADSSGSNQARSASETESAGARSASDSDYERTKKPKKKQASRIARIIENNPAKNPANEEIAEEFVELGGYELKHGLKQQGIHRMAVAKQIRLAEEPIESGEQANKKLHVGPSAAKKIDEILQHGKMKALEEYEEKEEEEEAKTVEEEEDA